MLRVTRILRMIGLTDDEWIDDFALKRGSLTHLAIHLAILDDLDEATVDPVHIAPRLASWRQWMNLIRPKVIGSEVHVVNAAMGYQGTLDFVGEIDGMLTLLDWKGGSPQPFHQYQTALYALAWTAERGGPTPARGSLYLHPEGKMPKLVMHKDRRDFERAKALVTTAYVLKESGMEVDDGQ